MKNMAKADSPKSSIAILPPRPCRESGKAAHATFNPARRDGKSFIPTVNHFSSDLGIPNLVSFRIADDERVGAPAAVDEIGSGRVDDRDGERRADILAVALASQSVVEAARHGVVNQSLDFCAALGI